MGFTKGQTTGFTVTGSTAVDVIPRMIEECIEFHCEPLRDGTLFILVSNFNWERSMGPILTGHTWWLGRTEQVNA